MVIPINPYPYPCPSSSCPTLFRISHLSLSANQNSGIGYITGNQEKQTQGNIDTQKAQFSYKQATSDGIGAIPVPSAEGLKGQFQSVEGILTGDQGKQLEGNTRAEKAAWRDGV